MQMQQEANVKVTYTTFIISLRRHYIFYSGALYFDDSSGKEIFIPGAM